MTEPLRVSALIAAAQCYLERRGDTPVGLVLDTPTGEILHIEDVFSTGEDCYDEGEEWRFELNAVTNDFQECVTAARLRESK